MKLQLHENWLENHNHKSVPITTDGVGSTSTQGEVYNIMW
jgi:hypothetical protein